MTAPASGSATYTVAATANSVTTPTASATVTVAPTSCTLTASPANPLPNGPVQLTGSCVNLPPGSTYSWTGPGTNVCTSSSLSCTVAAPATAGNVTYGVTANSASGSAAASASATVNVGGNGAAFGVADGTTVTVLDLLLAADARAVNGVLYNGNAALRDKANNVFSAVNGAGG